MAFDKDMTGNEIMPANMHPHSTPRTPGRLGDVMPINWKSRGPALDSAARVTASFELMAALLAEADLADVLTLIVRRAGPMAGADLAFIALPGQADHTLAIDFAAGLNAEHILGRTVRAGTSAIGRVFRTGRAMTSQVATNSRLDGLPAGPILLIPLDTGERTCGVLAVVGRPGRLPFSPSVVRQLLIFAATSTAMIEIAEERRGCHFG
jgi:transcriptional regulator with GAF, ATPase, and Fis domain